MKLRYAMLLAVCLVLTLAFAGAAAAAQQSSASDEAGQALLKALGGEEAGGWCTWTCSNGTGGSGPAPDPESCRLMCELSCGEPCEIMQQ